MFSTITIVLTKIGNNCKIQSFSKKSYLCTVIQTASTYRQATLNATYCGIFLSSSFTGKVKDSESGYHYFGARYYDSEALTGWLSVDPMADKYPSLSPYSYCAWSPVKLIDSDGKEYDDPPIANVVIKRGYAMVTSNGKKINYDLASNESYQQFERAINGIVTAGGTVTGVIYEGCKNSRSTFRITNSKGQLDFRIYNNGWSGNQYVNPKSLKALGQASKNAGTALAIASMAMSGWDFGSAIIQKKGDLSKLSADDWMNLVDIGMGYVGTMGTPELVISTTYSLLRNYGTEMMDYMIQDEIERARLMQAGYPTLKIGMR